MKMTRLALSLSLMAALLAGSGWLAASAEHMDGKAHDGAAACSKHKGHHEGGAKMDPAKWEAKRKEMHARFVKELSLTPEQDSKIQSIRENFKNAHKAEFEAMKAKHQEVMKLKQSGASAETMAAKRSEVKAEFSGLKADRERMNDEIKAVLTPEQRTKFEAMKQERHKKHGAYKDCKKG